MLRAQVSATGGLSICFVAHNAFGAMSGERSGFIGGIEHQQSIMARWLAHRGHAVSMITWDEGQPDGLEFDGVRVWKTCRRREGVPGLRFFAPRWTSLIAAMRRAGASIYYQNTAEYVTGQVALWASRQGRAFVYSVASDPDCDPSFPTLRTFRERALYRYGLRHADVVVAQTRTQQRMLADGFSRSSTVIPMPCVGPSDAEYQAPGAPEVGHARIAWIGRVAPVKRLELLLEVARLVPEASFDIAGPWDQDPSYGSRVRREAEGVQNVAILGRLLRKDMDAFYAAHHILCCTSSFEGFPNTFLEAWSHGLPIVSTVDPDGLIIERGLGEVAFDAASIAAALRRLIGSQERWTLASRSARRYFAENHAFEAAMPRFEETFRVAAQRKK